MSTLNVVDEGFYIQY